MAVFIITFNNSYIFSETLKYWVGVQQGQPYEWKMSLYPLLATLLVIMS